MDDETAHLVRYDRTFEQVSDELARQNEKWGTQDHDDGTGDMRRPLRGIATATVDRGARTPFDAAEERALTLANSAKAWCDARAKVGDVTWADILLEEVFEAIAEDPSSDELRAELIQVAAVALQWVDCIDRNA